MKGKFICLCFLFCVLTGCGQNADVVSGQIEPSSVSERSGAVESAPIPESVSEPESSSALELSSQSESLSVSDEAAIPHQVLPVAPPSSTVVPVEREYIQGRIFDPYTQSDPQDLVSKTNSYWNELREALPPSDYAFIGRDEVSGVIGICTMTPEKVQAVVAEHPNDFIEVRYFPADCTLAEIEAEIDRIKKEPMIQTFADKIDRVSSFNLADAYDVIFISYLEEEIPELTAWAKMFRSPFEIRVIVSQKTNPG